MTDLEPCPFCGGEASFKPRSFKTSCDLCGAYVPTGATSSDESIAAWNRRAPSAALLRAEEALSPLAAMADRYDPEDGDGDLECWSGLAVPKIRHIRAARAALSEIKKLRGE